jgi:hypothetical protein
MDLSNILDMIHQHNQMQYSTLCRNYKMESYISCTIGKDILNAHCTRSCMHLLDKYPRVMCLWNHWMLRKWPWVEHQFYRIHLGQCQSIYSNPRSNPPMDCSQYSQARYQLTDCYLDITSEILIFRMYLGWSHGRNCGSSKDWLMLSYQSKLGSIRKSIEFQSSTCCNSTSPGGSINKVWIKLLHEWLEILYFCCVLFLGGFAEIVFRNLIA